MALTGGVLWGCSGIMGSYLFTHNGFNAMLLVTIRLVSAGLIILITMFIKERGATFAILKNRRDLIQEIVFAFIAVMPCQLVYFIAVEVSNPSTATVLQSSAPIFVMLFYLLIDKRKPAKVEVVVLIAVMIGVLMISTHGDFGTLAITKIALVCGLGAALTAAIYNILPGNLLRKYGSASVTGWGMLISGIPMIPILRFTPAKVDMNITGWLCLTGVVILGTVIAQFAYLEGVRVLGAVQGSLFETVEPVVSTLLTVAVLHMTLTNADYIGTALILFGVITLALFGTRRSVKA